MKQFEEYERKVHYHHDNSGETFGIGNRPFANTLCKMNSEVPETHITNDPSKVTCKICRKDRRFKVAVNASFGNVNRDYGKMGYPEDMVKGGVLPHLQMFGRALRPGWLNGRRTRYRRTWFGKLVLQVEDMVPVNYDDSDPYETRSLDDVPHTGRWRDATLADLAVGVV